MTGPMICFTQEFYDGQEPPPSSLVDLPFWFPFETPPLLTLDASQARKFDSLWAEMEAEATPSKERDDIARALLRVLFYKAARIYLAPPALAWRSLEKRRIAVRKSILDRAAPRN
jgi:hypothetical protein